MMSMNRYIDLTLERGIELADDDSKPMLQDLADRLNGIRADQERFRTWCDRADALYHAETFTAGGADLWADDPSATTPGSSHVSINTPATYVDVPASLQSVPPIEKMLATDTTKEARAAASALERVYTAWKATEEYDLKFHKACTVKGLYGRTASRVYWDKVKGYPCADVVEQPRNLWLGYRSDSYEEIEWAAYAQLLDPNAVIEEFGVDIQVRDAEGAIIPFVSLDVQITSPQRPYLRLGPARIEVWDYWYRKPLWRNGKYVGMDTYNVIVAGNQVVRGPVKYPEYDGMIPYVPLFNTFLPGSPDGRPELYDMEQLIREKFERLTSGAQMIASGTAGDFWQLVGPEAPSRVPADLKPQRNKIVGPGPGNRIETITPFIAQFQLEQYLVRLDREMAVVSGLNDLLLGLAPAQVLSSSKAINALIANYESRLSMRRQLLYSWRRRTWELAVKVWAKRDKDVKQIVANGGGTLDITDPSLSPRDEMETATRVANLVNAKLWSQRRGMDAVHVDDPETEQDMIREERTDATLFPEEVQVIAQLMGALQALNLPAPAGIQNQAAGQVASGQDALRRALGSATPNNTTSSQLPGDQGNPQYIPGAAEAAGGQPPPFASAPAGAPQQTAQLQSMIQGGSVKGRILTQQQLGRR